MVMIWYDKMTFEVYTIIYMNLTLNTPNKDKILILILLKVKISHLEIFYNSNKLHQ